MKGSFYYNLKYAAIMRKPELMARLVHNVVRARLQKKKPILRYVDVCLLTKCNLTCVHCFATNFRRQGMEILSPNHWRSIAEQSCRLGCVSFGVTGGEPLLYKNLPDLVEQLLPHKNLITVNSNGTLLTPALAKTLYQVGVDVLQFSMDSSIPEEHDAFRRQKGAWSSLDRAVDIAVNAGLKVTLVCTVSHQNLHTEGFQGVIEYTRRKNLLLILSRAVPAGRWGGNKDILLTQEDQTYMYGLVKKHPFIRTDMDSNYARYGCSAATEKLYVTAYGDVIPCPFMHISFGNVRDDSIKTIRDRMMSQKCLSRYSKSCLVAEDHQFIDNTLSKTFDADTVVDWRDCFEKDSSDHSESTAAQVKDAT